jgi:hypothetical protein
MGMRRPVGLQFMPNLMPAQSRVDELSVVGRVIKAKAARRVNLDADLTIALDAQKQGRFPIDPT